MTELFQLHFCQGCIFNIVMDALLSTAITVSSLDVIHQLQRCAHLPWVQLMIYMQWCAVQQSPGSSQRWQSSAGGTSKRTTTEAPFWSDASEAGQSRPTSPLSFPSTGGSSWLRSLPDNR